MWVKCLFLAHFFSEQQKETSTVNTKLLPFSPQMDVHAFLFSDMLLLCKNLNKKLDSKVKVIRQPFLIDRLIINDVSSSATACLACVYLSEFGVAAAAFTLHSPEPKIIKVRYFKLLFPSISEICQKCI